MPFPKHISDGLEITCLITDVDWSAKLAISHYLPGDITEGLTSLESRRPAAEAMLLTVLAKIAAEAEEAQALRQTLATLGTGWVGLPIYSDEFLGAEAARLGARIYDSQRLIDLTVPAIVARDAALIADHTYAPLVVGHITQLPAVEPLSGTFALCSVTVTEDSPWEFRVGVFGATTAGFWPELYPDWSSPPKETPVVDYEFSRIGMQREQVIGRAESRTRLTTEAGFGFLSKAEVASLLSFFLRCRGQYYSFVAPCWFTPRGGHDWPLTADEKSNVAALVNQPSASAPDLGMFRFSDDVLKLDFTTSTVAASTVRLTQVPYEQPGDATALQPTRIYLYRITHDVPGSAVYRFTNCWRPLTRANDGTYVPAPMLHESIESGVDLSGESVTLNSFLFDGNPLALLVQNRMEGRLWLEIFEAENFNLDAGANGATLRWKGTVAAAPLTGRKIAARCEFLGGLMDREGPGVSTGPSCNTCLFSTWCGLQRAAFLSTGTITRTYGYSQDDGGLIVTFDRRPFQATQSLRGKLEIGSGKTYQSRLVVFGGGSAASFSLYTDRRFDLPENEMVGMQVKFSPECDGQVTTCKAFDPVGWRGRNRSHPNLPQVNLSLPSDNAATGGKK